MLRRCFARAIAPALVIAGIASPAIAEDPRVAADFLQGLRDREYFDLALEYLGTLRESPDTPAELKTLIDYEEARCLIGEAARSSDLEAARQTLDRAKSKIDAFVKANPDLPQTTEALVELAHLLYERGRIIARIAEEQRTPADTQARLSEARDTLAAARDAYSLAFDRLNAKFNAFPKFIPDDDPRKIERERVQTSLMQSELQKSVVDYEIAQTYPLKAPERKEYLDKGLAGFEEIYKRYRTQLVGFTARMWQGKTYEERGELGPAMGIYNELIDHPDPRLRVLQKQVDYFRIIVMGKRGEYAKAADECRRWLTMFPKDRRSFEALGVQLELAKSMLAQLPELSEDDQKRATKAAGDALVDVVRYFSPHKPEAVALLKKIRPSAALSASAIANLSYDDAMSQAEQSLSSQEYDRAISLFKGAVLKADPVKDAAKANKARFNQAFAAYMAKRYYESAVIAEHLARRYPSGENAPKAAEIGMAALVDAYNNEPGGDRTVDLDRLVDLAKYTSETWPDTEQGDSARIALGKIALGRGRYAEAIAAFDSLRDNSPKKTEAQSGSGDAHWKLGQALREQGKEKEADAEAKKAVDLLNAALKAKRDANTSDSDPSLVNIACDLAVIQLESGKSDDALKLLDPLAKALANATRTPSQNAAYGRVLTSILRGHVATNQVDKAIAGMKTLEESGIAGASGAQLYFELGKLLEREIEALKKKNDRRGLERTQKAYEQFLMALVASKSGQSIQSLQWAGENLLKLGNYKEAGSVFANILTIYGKDPDFLAKPGSNDRLLRVRIKQVAALVGERNFDEAGKQIEEIVKQNPRSLEAQMELGHLIDARAEAKQATWAQAHDHWRKLALKLASARQKPPEYYEAWYHAALALEKQGKKDLAQQSLASVVRLSNFAGATDMKAKYLETIKRLGK
ncbi:tetratricopeptide repeat protein [Tundrisphaera sp. TA3]|uniref:tetratricopeptide repeat protein n=1 Tax=Tundrisphaera sp. TA3 TaxID=3435775 RepID=UPI003EC123E6